MENYVAKFVTVEEGENDLILSFALAYGESEIISLILQRAPAFEFALPVDERGVTVSLEGDFSYDSCDNFLKKVRVSSGVVKIVSVFETYYIDISRIEKSEIKDLKLLLKKMNFDKSFKLES